MLACDTTKIELLDKTRWPKKPYCSDDLSVGIYPRTQSVAFGKTHIQANPPDRRIWSIFDIDRPGAVGAWEEANLPEPSWIAINKANGHAHCAYGLATPVLLDGTGVHQAPVRYLAAIEQSFREALGADRGYAGVITKNPTHPLWHTIYGARLGYELGELAEYVDLPKHPEKRKLSELGLGRNVTLFDYLREYAYPLLKEYKAKGFAEWQAHINIVAIEKNCTFNPPLPLPEVWHLVKSVSKWTWKKFDVATSDRRFSELQSHRGALGLAARWGDNDDRRELALGLSTQGKTVREIADILGVGKSTAARWVQPLSASN